MAGTSMTTHAALSGSIRGIERASLRARAPVRLTTRLPRRGLVDGSTSLEISDRRQAGAMDGDGDGPARGLVIFQAIPRRRRGCPREG